jgi:hypothetical protein
MEHVQQKTAEANGLADALYKVASAAVEAFLTTNNINLDVHEGMKVAALEAQEKIALFARYGSDVVADKGEILKMLAAHAGHPYTPGSPLSPVGGYALAALASAIRAALALACIDLSDAITKPPHLSIHSFLVRQHF